MTTIPYKIERLANGGQGISYTNDKVFFVEGALPGESGTADVLQEKKRFGRARAVSRESDSEMRVACDSCPQSASCGGCGFRHVRSDCALSLKAGALCAEIVKLAHLDPIEPVLYPVSGPNGGLDGLRRRIRLHVSHGRIGYFAKDSHYIVTASGCAAIDNALRKTVAALESSPKPPKGFACDLQIDLDDSDRPFLHVRAGEFEPSRVLKTAQAEPWVRQLEATGIFAGIRCGDCHWTGDSAIRDTVSIEGAQDIVYWRRIGDFAQATAAGNAHLHACVSAFLAQTKPQKVADLFAGSGNLSFRAAQSVPEVCAFEYFCDEAMFARGAADNQARDPNFGRVTLRLCDLTRGFPAAAAACEAIICDPAREGLSEKMCQDLCTSRVQHILYISCEATNLARDIARLKPSFHVASLGFVDMFPQTPHLETVAILSR